MNNPALIVFLAAVLVLVMMGLPVGVAILMRRDTRKEMQALEARMSERIDELNRLVSALLRAVQTEHQKAQEAVANTEQALMDIARNEGRFGNAELDYQAGMAQAKRQAMPK